MGGLSSLSIGACSPLTCSVGGDGESGAGARTAEELSARELAKVLTAAFVEAAIAWARSAVSVERRSFSTDTSLGVGKTIPTDLIGTIVTS